VLLGQLRVAPDQAVVACACCYGHWYSSIFLAVGNGTESKA
jgi:hypothetical protein